VLLSQSVSECIALKMRGYGGLSLATNLNWTSVVLSVLAFGVTQYGPWGPVGFVSGVVTGSIAMTPQDAVALTAYVLAVLCVVLFVGTGLLSRFPSDGREKLSPAIVIATDVFLAIAFAVARDTTYDYNTQPNALDSGGFLAILDGVTFVFNPCPYAQIADSTQDCVDLRVAVAFYSLVFLLFLVVAFRGCRPIGLARPVSYCTQFCVLVFLSAGYSQFWAAPIGATTEAKPLDPTYRLVALFSFSFVIVGWVAGWVGAAFSAFTEEEMVMKPMPVVVGAETSAACGCI